MERLKKIWIGGALILLNTLVFVLVIELSLSAASWLYNRSKPIDERAAASAYAGDDWVDDYWREFYKLEIVYEPYVMWRFDAFQGKLISISSDGIRTTAHQSDTPSHRIFFFGGSTMWGTGSPDDATIPSHVMKMAREDGKEGWTAVNFGQSGYAMKQELLLLIRELQRGNVPDAVVFYDGVNDVYAAYQSSRPDYPQNNDQIRRKLDGGAGSIMYSILEKSSIMNGMKFFVYHLTGKHVGIEAAKSDPAAAEKLAREVFDNYRGMRRVVESLAKSYGFKASFFWQPNIFHTKKNFDAFEAAIVSGADPRQKELYFAAHAFAAADTSPAFHDIASAFDAYEGALYIDFCHVSPKGNELVARAIYERLRRDR